MPMWQLAVYKASSGFMFENPAIEKKRVDKQETP